MPSCLSAREHIWIPFMRTNLSVGPDTILIGHSSGAIAAMRYAMQYQVAGLVLVATYESTLGLAMERRSEYFDTLWDWAAIKRNAGFIIQVGGQRQCARGPRRSRTATEASLARPLPPPPPPPSVPRARSLPPPPTHGSGRAA